MNASEGQLIIGDAAVIQQAQILIASIEEMRKAYGAQAKAMTT